jgi:hypothetical protein
MREEGALSRGVAANGSTKLERYSMGPAHFQIPLICPESLFWPLLRFGALRRILLAFDSQADIQKARE